MPDFFGVWLSIWVCTWSTALYQYLSNHEYASIPLVVLIGAELTALVVWLFYWMVLYPRYLTPFRHLPTPAVGFVHLLRKRNPAKMYQKRRFLYGNRKEMFPDQAWLDLWHVYQTLPNDGLVRYYEPLNKEVLLATKTEVVKEMFGLKSNDFGHPKNVQFMINQLTGSEFNFLSPHGHKVSFPICLEFSVLISAELPETSQTRLHSRAHPKDHAHDMGKIRPNGIPSPRRSAPQRQPHH